MKLFEDFAAWIIFGLSLIGVFALPVENGDLGTTSIFILALISMIFSFIIISINTYQFLKYKKQIEATHD